MCQRDTLSVLWPKVHSAVTKSALPSFKMDIGGGFREDLTFKSLSFTAPKGHLLCEALEIGGCYFLNLAKHS